MSLSLDIGQVAVVPVPPNQLGRLGFLYATNPTQDSVSGNVLLGSAHLGSSIAGNAAFGSIRTSDPDFRGTTGQISEPF